jgi:hypothetical protein
MRTTVTSIDIRRSTMFHDAHERILLTIRFIYSRECFWFPMFNFRHIDPNEYTSISDEFHWFEQQHIYIYQWVSLMSSFVSNVDVVLFDAHTRISTTIEEEKKNRWSSSYDKRLDRDAATSLTSFENNFRFLFSSIQCQLYLVFSTHMTRF